MGDVFDGCFDVKAIEINTVEDNPVVGWSRQNSQVDRSAGVKTDSRKENRSCQSLLMFQRKPPVSQKNFLLPSKFSSTMANMPSILRWIKSLLPLRPPSRRVFLVSDQPQ